MKLPVAYLIFQAAIIALFALVNPLLALWMVVLAVVITAGFYFFLKAIGSTGKDPAG